MTERRKKQERRQRGALAAFRKTGSSGRTVYSARNGSEGVYARGSCSRRRRLPRASLTFLLFLRSAGRVRRRAPPTFAFPSTSGRCGGCASSFAPFPFLPFFFRFASILMLFFFRPSQEALKGGKGSGPPPHAYGNEQESIRLAPEAYVCQL